MSLYPELCLEVVAANFRCRPTLRGVPAQQVGLLSELLPTDLPLEVTAPLIDREEYWQRCALARWDNCVLTDHGCSWKRLYFERHLAGFLEAVGPFTEAAEVRLATCKEYVFTLNIGQVLSPHSNWSSSSAAARAEVAPAVWLPASS